jgi:hypothetical protein
MTKKGKIPHIASYPLLWKYMDILYMGTSSIIDLLDHNEINEDIAKLQINITQFEKNVAEFFVSDAVTDNKIMEHYRNTVVGYLNLTKQYLYYITENDQELNHVSNGMNSVISFNPAGTKSKWTFSFSDEYNGNLLGHSDYLDQLLVQNAIKHCYDTILLQREVGERNIITEIISCTKSKIFSSTEIKYNPSSKFPYIWTPEKGFATS